jgi:hypothetical protein
MKLLRAVIVTVLSVVVLSCAVYGQTVAALPELVTDRPDFTESSDVVGRGVLQLEMGTTFDWDGDGHERTRSISTPLALMRIGVSRLLELRVSTDGYLFSSYGRGLTRTTTSGMADVELGGKVVLHEPGESGVALAIIPMVSLPTGSDDSSSTTLDPTVKVTWAADLPRGFGLSGNVNTSRLSDSRGRYNEYAVSGSLGYELREGWGAYLEGFGFIPQGRSVGQAWTVNTGLTRGIGGNAQIDVEFGRGVTSAAPNWFVGAGIGIRTAPFRGGR